MQDKKSGEMEDRLKQSTGVAEVTIPPFMYLKSKPIISCLLEWLLRAADLLAA